MAAGRKEQTGPGQVRPAFEYDFREFSVRPLKIPDGLGAKRNVVFCELSRRLRASDPSLQATTSAIQYFIMTASSAPLSPLPYAATGLPAYSNPSQ